MRGPFCPVEFFGVRLATTPAPIFGPLSLLFPVEFGHPFGLKATDAFLYRYRQAGAAALGYGVMGLDAFFPTQYDAADTRPISTLSRQRARVAPEIKLEPQS